MFLESADRAGFPSFINSALILLATYNVAVYAYRIWFHPLSKYPGPKSHAASSFIAWLALFRGDETKTHRALHEKYGPVVRVAPNSLSYTSGQAWKDIGGFAQNKVQLKKDPGLFGRQQRGAWSIINTPDDKDHARHRRHLSHAFSDQALRGQEPLIKTYFDLLIEQLNNQIDGPSKGKVDLVKWYNFTTFDIVGDLALGESFHALENGVYHAWVANIFIGVKIAVWFQLTLINPFFRLLAVVIFKLVPALTRARESHARYSDEKVDRRLAQQTDRKDFVSYIQQGKDTLSDAEMKNNMAILILAGSETTATLLSGLTYLILTHPRVYQKLQQEILTKFASEDEISFVNTGQLSYLSAVIEESLRIYPPVPQRIPRITGPQGNVIDGQYVPPSTSVAVMPYAAYRSKDNWHNPDEFFPERWTNEAPAEYVAKDDKSALQPFSIGPRNCLGKNLAYNEMRTIMARMIWNFDIKLMPESSDWLEQESYLLWKKPPLWVEISKRHGA